MARKDVRCFKTNDLPREKVPEFDRQLRGQERGLNDMTVDEYLKGRQAFDEGAVKRSADVAKDARALYRDNLVADLSDELREAGVGPEEATQKAAKQAAETMKTLAALHNPDLKAGGKDVISDFGDRNVNSRIGAQWNSGNNSRLSFLDAAAKGVPEGERGTTKMNAKLERCK
jgi:Novel toxin 15